ncbi:hypothetical protein [Burkholderia cepacia]|uniref:hypothetical protein n=1 Tax=Burkholderia cepacia TaxID=292 RepID=UPI00157A6840|nr:hypothetical protein [Burkholderia cepacia]MCA7894528.1 hypothetical protein [Burkholderia cepacia]MCA8137738.1 hypothetical protein [Burkholderia cepacia]NTX47651.1 hypothetical protein [Burkholderia cepacia]HEM7888213.1 hypothetical protein [Burkholderia cepacia]HEM8508498.1 hypothetical protein [Burkholderia cepacia]
MPLLNVDLPFLASRVLPECAWASFDAMSVRARLATLSISADQVGDQLVRDATLLALKVIDAPAFVALSAVRSALRFNSSLLRVSGDHVDDLLAVVSSPGPQKDGYAEYASWPRDKSERWYLAVTARDVAKALASR